MWLLDTDHLTILERGGSTAFPLQMRLGQVPISEVGTTIVNYEEQMRVRIFLFPSLFAPGTTIVNYEEQMRGWLSKAAKATTLEKIIAAYTSLEEHRDTFSALSVLSFDRIAAEQFERLRQARIRIGTKDLRIAAICLAHDAILLTRNLKDFGQVPGLKAEDWSA